QWTAVNNLNPHAPFDNEGFTTFHDALWFTGNAPGQGEQLYKLGNDGSVTKWTALNTGGGRLEPRRTFRVRRCTVVQRADCHSRPTAVQVGSGWQCDTVDGYARRL